MGFVEFAAVIRGRRMVRAFRSRPVPPATVDRLIELARRAPSAGNTQPWSFVVLEGDDTAKLWDATLPAGRRSRFRWQGLIEAPVVIVPLVSAAAYLRRYSEDDKSATGLGTRADAWPVPYWWVDGGMAVHALLLAAVDEGLGASFFGLFRNERAVLDALGVPREWRALGAVAIGWPAPDEPGRSARRPRPPLSAIVHRSGWNTGCEGADR
jgi:nitroreductase